MAREAPTNKAKRLKRVIAVLCVAAVVQAMVPFVVLAARGWRSQHTAAALPAKPAERTLPYPQLDLPFEISGSQYFPVAWSDVPGWNDDDQLAAYQTFRDLAGIA